MKAALKRIILHFMNPLDRLLLIVNGKRDLPPLHLRWDVGPLRGFESSGAEFRLYLKLFARLDKGSRVLDIGCGCGQIALAIRDELGAAGEYVGCDISRQSISWCTHHISARDPRFKFHHMDIYNGRYNPHGTISARGFHFPLEWGTFDVILLKSVFTHMKHDEVENYINQLRTLLRDDGKCLVTFFLIDDEARALSRAGKTAISFTGSDGVFYSDSALPESTVAYDEAIVRKAIRSAGLRLDQPIRHGTWSGRSEGLSHQDIVVLRRGR